MSSAARSTTPAVGSASASSCSNSPGAITMTSVPVVWAAFAASSANIVKTTATCAPASPQAYAISPALSSGFIGTTTAPERRIA